MSYQQATISNLAPGEEGYQLTSDPGNGSYVACLWSCARRHNQLLDCSYSARQVNQQGDTLTDAMGDPIKTAYTHPHTVPDIVDAGGITSVREQMLKVILGEPDAVVDLPDDIRDAIQAASYTS